MVKRTLTEVATDARVNDGQHTDIENDNLVCNIRINQDNGTVQYQTLESNSWKELGSLVDLIHNTAHELTENTVFSDEVADAIAKLRAQLDTIWDEDTEMLQLQHRTDNDGEITHLVLPLNTPLTDDITITRLYDKKGVFTADHIKNQLLEKNIEMFELWNIDLYVKPDNWNKVYQKKGKMSYPEYMNTQCIGETFSSKVFVTASSGVLTVLFAVFIQQMFALDPYLGLISLAATVLPVLPLVLPLTFLVETHELLRSTIQYHTKTPKKNELLFEV